MTGTTHAATLVIWPVHSLGRCGRSLDYLAILPPDRIRTTRKRSVSTPGHGRGVRTFKSTPLPHTSLHTVPQDAAGFGGKLLSRTLSRHEIQTFFQLRTRGRFLRYPGAGALANRVHAHEPSLRRQIAFSRYNIRRRAGFRQEFVFSDNDAQAQAAFIIGSASH